MLRCPVKKLDRPHQPQDERWVMPAHLGHHYQRDEIIKYADYRGDF